MPLLKQFLFAATLLVAFTIEAQSMEGRYDGMLACGPSSPNSPPVQFTRAVTITVNGESIVWAREASDAREFARTTLDGAEFALDASGEYRSGSGSSARWRTRGTVVFIEGRFNGDVSIVSADGMRTYAECEVTAVRTLSKIAESSAPSRRSPNPQPAQNSQLPSAERSAPMQASALLQAPFGKKSDDMCLDGICLEDDAGRLADITLTPRTEESRIREAQFRALTNSRNTTTLPENIEMKSCADGNRAAWGKKAERLCEILVLRIYRPINRDDLMFLKENPLPVCDNRGSAHTVSTNTPLGLVTIELKFANDGRLRVFEIIKAFAVDDASDRVELKRRLIEKHRPYLIWREDYESAATPWGGSVSVGLVDATPRIKLKMEAMSKRFGEKPVTNECAPPRKQIDVR